MGTRVRAAKYEFFLTRWAALYDWFKAAAAADAGGGGRGASATLSAAEVRQAPRSHGRRPRHSDH